jgi:BlaI family penicillinase repressor
MLTIMSSKGFVRKRRLGTGHVYEALIKRHKASGNMLRDLIDKVYDGSTLAVVQSLLDTADIDADELSAIRRLVNRKAKEQS